VSERRGALRCHRGHDACCHCGERLRAAPDHRDGSECGCPLVNVDLYGGPLDGDRWRFPRSILDHLPRLTERGLGRLYLLATVTEDADPIYLYEFAGHPEHDPESAVARERRA
jgi:hypothetical protein